MISNEERFQLLMDRRSKIEGIIVFTVLIGIIISFVFDMGDAKDKMIFGLLGLIVFQAHWMASSIQINRLLIKITKTNTRQLVLEQYKIKTDD